MKIIATKENLEAGINFWREDKKGWPQDLHNQLYQDLYSLKQEGLTQKWWSNLVDILWSWRAIRPKTKAYISARGVESLAQLENEYNKIITNNNMNEPSLLDFSWIEVSGLFKIAQSIKDVESPVFASKLCHFLLPDCFPVIDHDVIGINGTYSDYWTLCGKHWATCEDKLILINMIGSAIGDLIIPQYPFSTKIVELCWIGERQLERNIQSQN